MPASVNRRWFQFSLRGLLALTTVLAVWLGIHVQATRRQQRAIRMLHLVGGGVEYEKYGIDLPRGPLGLYAWVGEDYFFNVAHVDLAERHNFDYQTPCDGDLIALDDLPHLESVYLHDAQLSDAGMPHLLGHPKLRELQICSVPISDASFECLKRLQSLELLTLDNTMITGSGIECLQELPHLKELNLKGESYSAGLPKRLHGLRSLERLSLAVAPMEDIECLQELPHLKELDLSGESYSAGTLKRLRGLRSLERLYLAIPPMGDAELADLRYLPSTIKTLWLSTSEATGEGLAHLQSLPNLRALTLHMPNLRGAFVEPLKKLKHLEELTFNYSPVSESALLELKAALPKTVITTSL